MTATYRYLFCDLITDREIVALELSNVSFDRRIIQAGTFKGTIAVPSAEVAAQVRKIAPSAPEEIHTGPARTVVHVYREGQLWGTYLIWSAVPSSDERGHITVELQGASLESYLHRVEIRTDQTFSQIPQQVIAQALVDDMKFQPDADIGLNVEFEDLDHTLRDRTYLASEAATYGQRLTELANVDGGFEWMIKTYLGADGQRVRDWVAARQLGGTVDHIWTQPGNVLSWTYGTDATGSATSWRTRGGTVQDQLGEDSQPLLSEAYDDAELIEAGWPRLDATIDYNNVTEQQTLEDYALWWALTRRGVVRIPEVTVRLDERSRFNPNALGDYARVTLVNLWYPLDASGRPTFSRRWRVVGCEITPVSRESGQEECKVIFAEQGEG